MKKVLIILLIAISNFALGNKELIYEAIKANDVQALESILSNTEPDEYLIESWEFIIDDAIQSSTDAILPLLKFGFEHDFHTQISSIYPYKQSYNFISILRLNNDPLLSFAKKYYSNVFTEKTPIDSLSSLPIESLNLLLSHEINIENYAEIIRYKIKIIATENNINEFKKLLEKLVLNKIDEEIWSSIINDTLYYSHPEFIEEFILSLDEKNIHLNIGFYDFIKIIDKCNTKTVAISIKNNPNNIKDLSLISCHSPIFANIPIDNLNLLLQNGLSSKTYTCLICDKIEKLSINNDIEHIKSLLKQISPTDKDIIKSITTTTVSTNPSIETLKTIFEFATENGIEIISNKEDLIKAIKNSNEETATFLIEKYPHIFKTLQYNANDYNTNGYKITNELSQLSPNLLNLLLNNGLDIKLYALASGIKISSALNSMNKELAKSLLDRIEVTDANKDAWILAFQTILPAAINNIRELVLPILQLLEQHELKSINNSYYLSQIIQKCDEETATYAIIHYPNEMRDLGHYLFNDQTQVFDPNVQYFVTVPAISLVKGLSINLLTLLFDNGCNHLLAHLPVLDNGLKFLELLMQKDPNLVLKHFEFQDFFEKIIEHQRFDILEFLSQYSIKLETITAINADIDIKNIIGAAVSSTEHGGTDMLNHVLNTLNAHGHPAALASAAGLNNGTLFNNFLEKGYTADTNKTSETSMFGLAFAIQSGNMQAVGYYLEHGVDPNSSFNELDGISYVIFNDASHDHLVAKSKKLEILDLLIDHGLKISNIDIATCAQSGSLDLIKYFKEKGYNTKHSGIFVAACGSNNIELIDFLLEDGANINDPSALVAAVRTDNSRSSSVPKVVLHLIEKGANPNNLMALNEALKITDPELKIAKYLVEKGARVEPRCIIGAGLSGNSNTLRWTLEQTNTTITAELEAVINSPSHKIIKYTLDNLLPKNSVLIGISNYAYHFTDGIGAVASNLMDQNPHVFVIPLTDELAADDSIMIKFSGFINPGAGDSYPNLPEFSFKDMDKERMRDYEHLYLRIISFAKKYDIPYLGICLGSQHLVLNNDGYIQPVQGHGDTITVHFQKGSIPHFMTLLPNEKAKALQECLLEDISVKNADVAHGFAAVKNKLGHNVKLGAISAKDESVPQSVSYGHNLIGVQFHPERGYFKGEEGTINRQKNLLDNFFENTLDHQKSRTYALQYGLHYTEVKDLIYNANQKLLKHLEACAKDPEYRGNDHFWGKDLGEYSIPADAPQNGAVNILTGLTPKDVALARDGDDLILIIKSTGDMLSIESHFAKDGDHRVKSIDFADGSRLILSNDDEVQDGISSHIESQANFYRNATAL